MTYSKKINKLRYYLLLKLIPDLKKHLLVLSAALFWVIFEIFGVFHSLEANTEWSLPFIEATINGDKGRVISLFGGLALFAIHAIEVFVCGRGTQMKQLGFFCSIIFLVAMATFFDFGSLFDLFLLMTLLVSSYVIKIQLFYNCERG